MTTSLRQAMRCGLEKTLAELDPTALDGMSVSSDERLDRRLTRSPESATTACRLADDSVAGAIGCLKRAAGLQLVAWDLGRDSARDVRRDSIGSVLACANPRARRLKPARGKWFIVAAAVVPAELSHQIPMMRGASPVCFSDRARIRRRGGEASDGTPADGVQGHSTRDARASPCTPPPKGGEP